MAEILETFISLCSLLITITIAYIESFIYLFVNRPMKSVKNKVIVITGSGHGLGKELAFIFSSMGAHLALIDVNKDTNDSVAQEILNNGGYAISYHCDLTNEENVIEIAKQIKSDLGDVHILINNAGIVQCVPYNCLSNKQIRKTFEVNTMSHFWTIQQFLPDMIKQGKGHIVAIASIAGLIGTAHLVDYCASKFAIVGLMEALEYEIHANKSNLGIHFTTICPLSMTTGMFKHPKTRFSWIFPVVNAKFAAKASVKAILRNQSLITIPKSAYLFYRIGKIVPLKVKNALQQFFGYGVDPHDD